MFADGEFEPQDNKKAFLVRWLNDRRARRRWPKGRRPRTAASASPERTLRISK